MKTPKPIKTMESQRDYSRAMETKHGDTANMLDNCILCQKTKAYKECQPDCPYIEAQG